MKKRTLIIGGAAVGLLLGIGAIGSATSDPVEVTVAATTTTESTTTTEEPAATIAPETTTTVARTTTTTEYELTENDWKTIFFAYVHSNLTYPVDDETAYALAISACDALDVGVSFEALSLSAITTLAGEGQEYLVEDIGKVYGAGIQAFCPQHAWQIG